MLMVLPALTIAALTSGTGLLPATADSSSPGLHAFTDPSPTSTDGPSPDPSDSPSPDPSQTPTAPVGTDAMPGQAQVDLPSTDPANTAHNAGWGDLAGGTAARPYVTSLSVVNGDQETPVIVGGGTAAPATSTGLVSAVVSPVNLCRTGQTPSPNSCYATPNRVALTVGYTTEQGLLGFNFANPSATVSPQVGPDSVIDMTVALNSLGQNLRWSMVNGDLLSWATSNLGQPDASVHLRFKPATSPWVQHFPAQNGCTATPIFDCSIPQADGDLLTASVLFSLDDTLDPALTGAVFATQNAIGGYLAPGGSAAAPTLDIQAASTHLRADGAAQLGTVEAFIPAATLLNLYGILPADAAGTFTATRSGDAGTNNPPTFAPWTAAEHGSDGLFVTVSAITFSVPKYAVRSRLALITTSARARGAHTTVTATVRACSKRAVCSVSVYDLGHGRPRYRTTSTAVLLNHRVATSAIAVVTASKRLAHAHRYLLVVRAASHHLLVSTLGTVD